MSLPAPPSYPRRSETRLRLSEAGFLFSGAVTLAPVAGRSTSGTTSGWRRRSSTPTPMPTSRAAPATRSPCGTTSPRSSDGSSGPASSSTFRPSRPRRASSGPRSHCRS
jgi:hypothetical protein